MLLLLDLRDPEDNHSAVTRELDNRGNHLIFLLFAYFPLLVPCLRTRADPSPIPQRIYPFHFTNSSLVNSAFFFNRGRFIISTPFLGPQGARAHLPSVHVPKDPSHSSNLSNPFRSESTESPHTTQIPARDHWRGARGGNKFAYVQR